MPFSLGQIFGGWRRKAGDAFKASRTGNENSRRRFSETPPRGKTPPSGKKPGFWGVSKPGFEELGVEERGVPPAAVSQSELAYGVIIAPHISEKVGGERGNYIFKVAGSANKIQIAQAIEARYKVKVLAVNIINTAAKPRRRGQIEGSKSGYKKAVVKLEEGQSITTF